MKTSELTGAALDWAVAKCEGFYWHIEVKPTAYGPKPFVFEEHGEVSCLFQPSTRWAQGGPIIEYEIITLDVATTDYDEEKDAVVRLTTPIWYAVMKADGDDDEIMMRGKTPLIAAMRCYVASKLGDEVDVPEELK